MTVTVSFNNPQIQVNNGSTGIQLSQVILPYSIRNSEDSTKYLGGQMTLGQSDGIKLTDNTKDWERLGLAKIKAMVADAEIYVPDPVISIPEELPESSAVEAPASSAEASEDTVATSVSSEASEAPASSEAPVSSAVEAPEELPTSSADDLVASSEATVVSSAPVTEAPVEASVTEVQ